VRSWMVIAGLGLSATASAQTTAPAGAPVAIPNGFLGYTFCRNGLPETWIRADIVGTPEAEEVLAHEAVHRAQAMAAPSCEAFIAGLKSARRVIETEIPAYCAQWAVVRDRAGNAPGPRVPAGAESGSGTKEAGRRSSTLRDSTLREYALRISAQSGAMENRLDVFERLRAACP